MAISDRIESTLQRWANMWKAPIRFFLSEAIGFGMETILDILGKKQAQLYGPAIKKLQETGAVPPELQPVLDEITNPTGETAAAFGLGLHGPIVGNAIGRMADAAFAPFSFALARATRNTLPDFQMMLAAYHSGLTDKSGNFSFEYYLKSQGFEDKYIEMILNLARVRFPSEVIGPMWLRDKAKYGKFWQDVTDLGIDAEHIELLKESLYHMPTPQNAVSWMAHEVFEPDMIAKYGLDDEWEKLDKSLFEKIGLKEDMALNYWRDHWEHPNYSQIREMRHKGLLTDEDVYNWFRLVEIPPYWRKQLTAMMWEVPGRVELRMMAQYGLIDKKYVMDILEKDGLGEQYRSIVADMMLVRGARTDIQTRYQKGWLDSAGVKAEIDALQLDPAIAERMFKWIVVNVKGDRTAPEKDLTKAEIIKGVKEGMVDPQTAIDYLMGMGYDEDEANYLIAINVEVVQGIPSDELKLRIDTVRRLRRAGSITESDEIRQLVALGLDSQLSAAYAENDSLRLTAAAKAAESDTGV